MADSVNCRLVLLGALFVAAPVVAEDALPDADFLEYLGSWDGSDEDWVALADEQDADANKGTKTGRTEDSLSGVSEESHEDQT